MSQCTRTIEVNGVSLEVIFDYTPAEPENGVVEDMELEEVIVGGYDMFNIVKDCEKFKQMIYDAMAKAREEER
jgi:hypothetical protein